MLAREVGEAVGLHVAARSQVADEVDRLDGRARGAAGHRRRVVDAQCARSGIEDVHARSVLVVHLGDVEHHAVDAHGERLDVDRHPSCDGDAEHEGGRVADLQLHRGADAAQERHGCNRSCDQVPAASRW